MTNTTREGAADATDGADGAAGSPGALDGGSDGRDGRDGDDRDEPNEDTTFRTYADEEYGYRLVYPTDWVVEAEPSGGASFDAREGSAGAVVDVDEGIDLTLAEYVAAFLDELDSDEHVRALECLDRRDIALDGGGTGRVVEYTYLSGSRDERWRLTYLFACDGATGYTLGVDWNEADRLEEVAARIVESFAIDPTGSNGATDGVNGR